MSSSIQLLVSQSSDFIETIAPEHGGDDLIFVGEGADVVLGGSGMPMWFMLVLVHFSDVVLGDNGEVDFDTFDCLPGTASRLQTLTSTARHRLGWCRRDHCW